MMAKLRFLESSVHFKAQMPPDNYVRLFLHPPFNTLCSSDVVLWVQILCICKQTLEFIPAKMTWEFGQDVSVFSLSFSFLRETVIRLLLELPNEQ